MLSFLRVHFSYALIFWFVHTLASAFFLLCEIEVTYGVAADFGGATTFGQKSGQVFFRILGFPFLSFLWDTPYFEGRQIWWVVAANSAVWTWAACAVIYFIVSRHSAPNAVE